MIYAERIRKNPEKSLTYQSDAYFRNHLEKTSSEQKPFLLGHKLILVEMLAVLIWIVWGVTQKGYYIPRLLLNSLLWAWGRNHSGSFQIRKYGLE